MEMLTAVLGHECLNHPVAVQVQFRYAYVCDHDGIKVLELHREDGSRAVPLDEVGGVEQPPRPVAVTEG